MYTESQKNEFVTLRAEGLSFDKISEKLKIPVRTLFRWAKDKADEINTMKDAAFESLLESLKVNAGNRLRMLAEDLNKINKRTAISSFNYISDIDLLKYKLKIIDKLSKFDTSAKTNNNENDGATEPDDDDDNPDAHIEKIINSKNTDLRKNPLILDRINFEKQLNEELNLFNQKETKDD
jgi:hypothetical protein